ncbi:MAG: hypothetical protein KGM43_13790 [Planctomycetota bacterium]|nr:hypothetical protein [Planctomycetota bacterium]
MRSCSSETTLRSLELPPEYEDLTGLLQADMKAIVIALADRAGDRMLMSRRRRLKLRRDLWNNLAKAVRETMEPLSAELQ